MILLKKILSLPVPDANRAVDARHIKAIAES